MSNMFSSALVALLLSAGLTQAGVPQPLSALRTRADNGLTLLANAIQKGSFNDGSDEIGSAEVGQAKSATSQNNFINNCAGKTLTNGLQITTGSCNGIIMGDIPAKTNMVSSIILFPPPGSATIESDTTFNITVQMANLVAGSFTNADATYYAAPQTLSGGNVVGHTHVTVQDMGKSLNPTTPLDPTQFAFFKGINDPGNGKGLLSATVNGGLPAGNYRVCTLASSSNHQPVLMPVAQRGSADDCTKFTVIGTGTTANAASNNGSGGQAAAALAAAAVSAGPDVAESSAGSGGAAKQTSVAATTSAASAATSAASSGKGKGSSGGSGKGSSGGSGKGSSSGNSGNGGSQRGNAGGNGSGSNSITKEIISIIETFFEFAESALGGAVPPVGKSGGQFNVFDELFDDLASAASASCGHQFTACQEVAGQGFSIEECVSQRDACSSAASSQKSTATAPVTVTATQVVPVTATVTIGSAIATSTVSTSVSIASSEAAATTIAAASSQAAPSKVGQAVGTDSSVCSVVTVTATVQPAAATA